MPFLPCLPGGATLLDVFRMFPETSKPLIEFHEAMLIKCWKTPSSTPSNFAVAA
jgi:hypothetical protein